MAVFLQKTFILLKNSNSNYLKHKNISIEKLWITQFGPMGPPWGTLGPYLGSESWNVFKTQWSWSSRVWRIPPYQFQLWKISGHLQELPHRCEKITNTIEHTLRGLCLNISTPIFPFLWTFWVPCMHAVWVLTRRTMLAEPIWTHVVIIQPLSTNLWNFLAKSIIPLFHPIIRDDFLLEENVLIYCRLFFTDFC